MNYHVGLKCFTLMFGIMSDQNFVVNFREIPNELFTYNHIKKKKNFRLIYGGRIVCILFLQKKTD